MLVLRHNEPPGNEPDNNNKGEPRFSRHFSKDKVNVEGQMFPPFSAAKELENNRRAHFVKRHALCHHPIWRTGCCLIKNGRPDMTHPTWPTGYDVMQNGRADMKSSKWRTGYNVIQDGDRMLRQRDEKMLGR